MSQDSLNIALIIGCARSGTSILGELVAANPGVKYIFEAHDVWEAAGVRKDGSHRLTAGDATVEIRRSIRRWFADQQGDAMMLAEKTPRNVLRVPFLRAVFPEAKLIHIVRDGRDVACSMLPGIGGDEWLHLRPPSWKMFADKTSGIERCALVWKQTIQIARSDLKDVPHLEVRYEELVDRPRDVAASVTEYLGLPPSREVERLCEKIQNETAGSYHAQHQVRWFRDDHGKRVGRWKENLSAQQQEIVNKLLGGVLKELNYP